MAWPWDRSLLVSAMAGNSGGHPTGGTRLLCPRSGTAISLPLASSLKILHRANLNPVDVNIVSPSVWDCPAVLFDYRPITVFEWDSGHRPILAPFARLGSIIIHYSSSHE
jgi:hypothetical protein